MTVAAPYAQTGWTRGQWAQLTLDITGPSPVTLVTADLLGDGRPAWALPLADGRGRVVAQVGPLGPAGTYELEVTVEDSRGCQTALVPRPRVTIR